MKTLLSVVKSFQQSLSVLSAVSCGANNTTGLHSIVRPAPPPALYIDPADDYLYYSRGRFTISDRIMEKLYSCTIAYFSKNVTSFLGELTTS